MEVPKSNDTEWEAIIADLGDYYEYEQDAANALQFLKTAFSDDPESLAFLMKYHAFDEGEVNWHELISDLRSSGSTQTEGEG